MFDEFERWYDEVHIPEILERYPEVASVVRYRLSPSLTRDVEHLHDSAAVYEVRGSAAELWDRLAADRSLTVGQGFDYKRTVATFSA
ncbi:hypothetical protein ACNJ7K_10645 [Rhodococcus aetherivorans]